MNPVTAPEKQQYQYFAFISYSSKDLRWGRRLQRSLERYRLPSHLTRKYKDKPARAYPICRDETAFAGFKVRGEIQEKLDKSHFLIVLCSPRSAKSDWVNDEIQYFIDRGGENRILPFIIDGVPHSGDPATECYPPALLAMAEDPLGVDVQALGKCRAYLRMVSTLLDVDFDELTRRDVRRRVRNGGILGLAGLLAAAVIAGGIAYNLPRSSYYNAVTYRNEIPEGLYPLTREQVSTTNSCYRLTTHRGKVIRLETVNSLGVVMEPLNTTTTTDYPILEYEYNESTGQLIAVVQKDATGKEVSRKELTANPATWEIGIEFHSPGNNLDAHALSADMSATVIGDRSNLAKSEITRQRNTYDEDGRLIRTLYQRDNLGTPACDMGGVYGKLFTYNEEGLITRISNLDASGQVYNCKYGWAYETLVYDEMGNEIHAQYYDAQGNPARGKQGYSASAAEYDAAGNMVLWKCMDETGALCHNSNGIAMQKIQYDANGFLLSVKDYDAQGAPTYDTAGIHEFRYQYDAQGRVCGMSYFGIEGQSVYSPVNSCASFQCLLDAQGRVLEYWLYDAQGSLTCQRELGIYGTRNTYDENGNLILLEYLDAEGQLALCRGGYAFSVFHVDAAGQLLREECRDTDGNLICGSGNVAIAEYTYDTFGNVIQTSIFDENGMPCYHSGGYSTVSCVYEDGNLVSESYFDTNGQPMLCNDYYHQVRYDYDRTGNVLRWSYYDTEGNLLLLPDGYAIIEQDYDLYGNVTAKRYYDADGEPAPVDLVYEYRWEYDSRGNMLREEHLAYLPEQLTYSVLEMEYDLHGNRIADNYYDQNGEPVDLEGYGARMEYDYDARGNLLETRWFGPDGLPLAAGSEEHQNIRRQTFDPTGNLIRTEHLNQDASGNIRLLWQEVYSYDAFGNCIREELLDEDGKMQPNALGYSILEKTYSALGFTASKAYYDENGDPCPVEDVFRYEYTYDHMGHCTEMRRYGTDGELLPEDTSLAAIVTYAYDTRGKLTQYHLYNAQGEPFNPSADSYCFVTYQVDAMGYEDRVVYYNEDGTVMGSYIPYVYIKEVYPGTEGEMAGIQANDLILRYGQWSLFETESDSITHAFQTALVNGFGEEKTVELCRMEGEEYRFYRVEMPAGGMGCRIASDTGNQTVLTEIQQAYAQWLEE